MFPWMTPSVAAKLPPMSESDLRDAWPKMTFVLEHEGPVPLSDFTHALERLGQRYVREVRESGDGGEPQLYIAEIRKGSVIIDLITRDGPKILDALGKTNALFTFGKNLKTLVDHFTGKAPKEGVTKADCDDMRALAAPAIHTLNATINIYLNGGEVEPIRLTQTAAIEADNRAAAERQQLVQQEEHILPEVLLVWDQVRDAPGVDTGRSPDRGIIASVDNKPRQVTFASDDLKEQMGRHGFNPFEKAYIVDVRVMIGPNGPVAYRVLKLHDIIDRD